MRPDGRPIRVLVAGRHGQLAQALAAESRPGFDLIFRGRGEMDIADADAVRRTVELDMPDIVVNAAAYTAVDKAEDDEAAARLVNETGARNLAVAAALRDIAIVHISTDYVFSGEKSGPYVETDACEPLGVYGRSKRAGELAVAAANRRHIILRTAWVHSEFGGNFLKTMLRLSAERATVRVVADQRGSPTYARDLAAAILAASSAAVARPGEAAWRGTFHLVSRGAASWADFADEIFRQSARLGGPSAMVEPVATDQYPTRARRPRSSVLDATRFETTFDHPMAEWRDGVARCVAALNPTP